MPTAVMMETARSICASVCAELMLERMSERLAGVAGGQGQIDIDALIEEAGSRIASPSPGPAS